MWNLGPIDFEATRDGQEFQAKSGVARVVNPSSQSAKLSKSEYTAISDQGSGYKGSEKDNASYSKAKRMLEESAAQIIPIIFAVFINLLDACTFGTVFFPSQLGNGISGLAIELFLLSTVIVQLVLIKMSSFSCGLGTSMAENIPLVHTMATGIFDTLQSTHSVQQMLPTVLVTVCLSTIINGVLFFVVGYFKLGHVLHFFPRHVIMGMTAGFGVFLMSTAIESSTGIVMSTQTLHSFLLALSPSRCYQLVVVMSFEAALRLVEYLKFNELAVPCMMFFLPIAFYIVLAMSGTSFEQARGGDWLFPETASANWWDTWVLFDFSMVEWHAVIGQWTTISSLAFFTLILVPIRIPSLSIITEDDVNFDEELKAQGIANILSGMCGAVHNYLSYSNSIFFFYVGGRGKWSQMAVTLLTLLLFFVGPQIINYVPRLIAGVIMLHLGVDLVVGALISSRKALDNLEYSSVLFIATVVSFQGFVPGIFMGVVSACVTFVVQSSRQSSIRAVFSGDTARSNTSWSSRQRDKLDVGLLGGSSIIVVQLQGHLFFGNVQQVVEGIESALMSNLEAEAESALAGTVSPTAHCQLRYLILDCSFVTGADVNAVTGLLKMREQIAAKYNNISDGFSNSMNNLNELGVVVPGKKIQVRVLFAGLQNSLEAMFSLQEESLAEQQKVKASKEFEKDVRRMSFRDGMERSQSFYNRERNLEQKRKLGKHFWRDEVDDRLHGYEAISSVPDVSAASTGDFKASVSTLISCMNFEVRDVYHDGNNDINEMSGYDSAHSFDSYSSKSDSNDMPAKFATPAIEEEKKGEEISEKKRGRSPSWGSTSMSTLLKGGGGSSSNILALAQSCLITEMLSQAESPSPKPPSHSPTPKVMMAPQAVRPSPLLRLFEIEGNTSNGGNNGNNGNSGNNGYSADGENGEKGKVSEVELSVTEPSSRNVTEPSSRNSSASVTIATSSITKTDTSSIYNTATSHATSRATSSAPSEHSATPFRMNTHHVSNRPLSRMFYSDVNTALQAVEERIIKTTPLPKSRVSSFYQRRLPGKNALQHSMSAELRREDIVHSPEASGSSLDDHWAKHLKLSMKTFPSPPHSESSTPSPIPQSSWLVGPQAYNINGTETTPLLPIPPIKRIPSLRTGTGGRSDSQRRLSTHIEGDNSNNASTNDMEKEGGIVKYSPDSKPDSKYPLDSTENGSGKGASTSSNGNGSSGKLIETAVKAINSPRNSPRKPLSDLVIPVPTVQYVPHSPLSPNSKHLKMRITNMIFDLSSQWTMADSATLKRLARRLRKGVILVKKREVLWEAGHDALHMGILLSGRLKAVLRSNSDANNSVTRTLQVILPGTIFGELGLLSRGSHSRTIIASADSRISMLSRDSLDEIEETDKALLCVLQHLALRTAAGRSHELMLFSAGSLGP